MDLGPGVERHHIKLGRKLPNNDNGNGNLDSDLQTLTDLFEPVFRGSSALFRCFGFGRSCTSNFM